MNFYETLKHHKGYFMCKWEQYFHIYNKFLAPFVLKGQPINLLEIGINNGGSLEVWNEYLPKGSRVTGVDIDERCGELKYNEDVEVFISDASDEKFVNKEFKDKKFDVIIDDGSHICGQVIKSFEMLFEKLNFGGLYIIEDVHTSYWAGAPYNGGYKGENSTMEYFKALLDCLNFDYMDKNDKQLKYFNCLPNEQYKRLEKYNKEIASITFYDSVIIIEKYNRLKSQPFKNIYLDGENIFNSKADAIAKGLPEFYPELETESYFNN